MRIEKDYENLLKLFNKHKVQYCIVGAFAMAFYAKPRYTKCIDILINPVQSNAKRLIKALEDFGFASLGLTEKNFCREQTTMQLGYEPVRIDLMTSIPGCSFKQVWSNRQIGIYGKQKVNFIGLDEFIKNKKATKGKKDKIDLEILLKKKRIDTRFKIPDS